MKQKKWIILTIFFLNSLTFAKEYELSLDVALNPYSFHEKQIAPLHPILRFGIPVTERSKLFLGLTCYRQYRGWYDHYVAQQVFIPITMKCAYGDINIFELGFGLALGYGWSIDTRVIPKQKVVVYPEFLTGYKFNPKNSCIYYCLGITHSFEYLTTYLYTPYPFASIGYRFASKR